MSGGATIQVSGVTSGTVVDFTPGGPRAILYGAGSAPNLTLVGDNAHVAGLEIVGSSGGIPLNTGVLVASGVRDVRIAGAHIDNTRGNGISFGARSSGEVSGGVIERTLGAGISIDQDSTVRITGTTITETGGGGISTSAGTTVTIAGTTIAETGAPGIHIPNNNNVTITDTTITDSDSSGLLIVGNNTVTITGTTIANAGSHGIHIGGDNTVTLSDSVLTGMFGSNGVEIFDGVTALSGDNNTAAGATFGGQFCSESLGSTTGSFGFVNRGVSMPTPGTCP